MENPGEGECAGQPAHVPIAIFNTSLNQAIVSPCFKSAPIILVPKKPTITCLIYFWHIHYQEVLRKGEKYIHHLSLTHESLLTSCISGWSGSCKASYWSSLQRVVRTVETIVGTLLFPAQDIVRRRCLASACPFTCFMFFSTGSKMQWNFVLEIHCCECGQWE